MATVTTRRKRKGRGNPLAGFDASIEEKTALDQYLRDVSRHELITPDKEKELGALAQNGDQDAIQELARAQSSIRHQCGEEVSEPGCGPYGPDSGRECRAGHCGSEVRPGAGREVHQLTRYGGSARRFSRRSRTTGGLCVFRSTALLIWRVSSGRRSASSRS